MGAEAGQNVVPADVRFYANTTAEQYHNFSILFPKFVSIWGVLDGDSQGDGLFPYTSLSNTSTYWNNKYAFDLENTTANVDVDKGSGGGADYFCFIVGSNGSNIYYVRIKLDIESIIVGTDVTKFMVETGNDVYSNTDARGAPFTRSSSSLASTVDLPVILPIPAMLRLM